MSQAGSSDDGASQREASTDELPAVDYSTFILSLGHSALMHLGIAPDPNATGEETNLVMAKQTIDLIALLEEKTRGNLTGEEERLMDQLLYDLRSHYLAATSGA